MLELKKERKIFGLCSSEVWGTIGQEWSLEGNNFCSFLFGQRRTDEFPLVFFLVGEKPKHLYSLSNA